MLGRLLWGRMARSWRENSAEEIVAFPVSGGWGIIHANVRSRLSIANEVPGWGEPARSTIRRHRREMCGRRGEMMNAGQSSRSGNRCGGVLAERMVRLGVIGRVWLHLIRDMLLLLRGRGLKG
jgi:hypothetical protein